jgi:hypothetical protein
MFNRKCTDLDRGRGFLLSGNAPAFLFQSPSRRTMALALKKHSKAAPSLIGPIFQHLPVGLSFRSNVFVLHEGRVLRLLFSH